MHDAFGDGWLDADYTWSGVDSSGAATPLKTGTFDPVAAEPGKVFEKVMLKEDTVCAYDAETYPCYQLEVSGGAAPDEVSWSMSAFGATYTKVEPCEVATFCQDSSQVLGPRYHAVAQWGGSLR